MLARSLLRLSTTGCDQLIPWDNVAVARVGSRKGMLVQNRYAGDIGDYVKYALLRALASGRRLGVAWYLHPDTGPIGDGRHTKYLDDPQWRDLEPVVFDALKKVVDGGKRNVGAVESSGALPAGTKFHGAQLNVRCIPAVERDGWRARWFEGVLAVLSTCDVVFADPDNGLFPEAHGPQPPWLKSVFKASRKVNAKRMPQGEALRVSAGRPTVVYHHNCRVGHDKEIKWWMTHLPGCTCAYYWRRFSNRTFFVINADSAIERRIEAFALSWRGCGRLYLSDGKVLDP